MIVAGEHFCAQIAFTLNDLFQVTKEKQTLSSETPAFFNEFDTYLSSEFKVKMPNLQNLLK